MCCKYMCNNYIKNLKTSKMSRVRLCWLARNTGVHSNTCNSLIYTVHALPSAGEEAPCRQRPQSHISTAVSFNRTILTSFFREQMLQFVWKNSCVLGRWRDGHKCLLFQGHFKNLNNYFVPFVISMSWYLISELLREFKGKFLWIWLLVLSSVLWFIPK